MQGCQLQMRGSLQMRQFDNRVVPQSGLDTMCIDSELLDLLKEVRSDGIVEEGKCSVRSG